MASQSASGGLREELRSDAGTITQSAKERLGSEIDARKGIATNQAKSLSSALDKAAGELNDSPEWLRSILQQGAQTLQRFADTVEQKDGRELTRDVQRLARENPGMFFGACALAGFAAARVLKAGAGTSGSTGSTSGANSVEPYQAGDPVGTSAMPLPGGIDPQALGSSPAGFGDV
jgi:hypothetical protein